jgi:hypothetical protein
MAPKHHEAVDPDDPATWPPDVLGWVRAEADRLAGMAEFASDLSTALAEREHKLRALIAPRKVLVYHATRLLEHEIAEIRASGLVPLSRNLVNRRIRRAYECGLLTTAERDRLDANTVYALDEQEGREGQICFEVGRSAFDDSSSGFAWLLSLWGGEGIYWALADERDPPTLGRPTIVVAQIDVAVPEDHLRVFPGLAPVFVGTVLRLPGRYGDVLFRPPVPASDILDLWHPGDPEYDRHPGLPTT